MTLAVEHTLVEPFVGEKTDYHSRFKALAEVLRADAGLKVKGQALYVNTPVNVVPRGAKAPAIAAEVAAWLLANRSRFSREWSVEECPSPSHPNRTIPLQVRVSDVSSEKAFAIVQRYGDMKVDESVRRALERKLPKLVSTKAVRRILMLERDQGWVYPLTIHEEVERLRPSFPELSEVSEVWIADTVSLTDVKEYAEFERFEDGKPRESFAFFQGKLFSRSRNGVPLPVDSI